VPGGVCALGFPQLLLLQAVSEPPVWEQLLRHCIRAQERAEKRQQRLQQEKQPLGLPLNPEGEHGYHLRAKQRKCYKV
jgi:hypothetical protein